MRFILNAAGCPNDKIDSVINGALKDEIQDMIPKEGILVENINELLLQKVTDITDEHRKKLLAYMETNNYIKINKGNVYNIKHGIPNIPVIL